VEGSSGSGLREVAEFSILLTTGMMERSCAVAGCSATVPRSLSLLSIITAGVEVFTQVILLTAHSIIIKNGRKAAY
jgi:hypothetical protein